MEKKKKTPTWSFGKIESKEDCESIMKEVGIGFAVLGVIQWLIGCFVMWWWAIIDGVLFIVLWILLKYLNSRTVAILLSILALLAIYSTFMNNIWAWTGGKNTILSLIMWFAALRWMQATFKYHKLKG